ncbi:MAG TPA: multiheme c-type cytochrome, partial [Desulfuromonadaceae bacterium]
VNTPDSSCNQCHTATVQSWLASGHLQPLYSGIKETVASGGHYNATSCAVCHTVGYAQYRTATNANGFSDVAAAEGGLKFTQGDPDPATSLWGTNPKASKLIGIQCENCHGPQNSAGHMVSGSLSDLGTLTVPVGNSRVSYASEVCASCHGRAMNHARYQQWVLGAGPGKFSHGNHATYTFNADETTGALGNCQACHSAQGFAAWRKTLPNSPAYANTAVPGLTVSNAQPITCVACHDPHNEGDADMVEAGNLTKVGATEGSTYVLPGGFQANGVGKGALCITCHNSRTGMITAAPYSSTAPGYNLHEDGTTWAAFATPTSYSAPHEACQGDVLMGRNAYWLGADKYNSTSTRSKHSYITDTCVTCHMDLTDPSPYGAAGQKRHDFVATLDICNTCHTAYSGEAVQTAFDAQLKIVKQAVGQAILRLKYNDSIPAGTTAVLVANRQGQIDVTTSGVTRRWFISTRANNDAFLTDPNNNGALVQGCAGTATLASCTGYLAGVATPTATTLALTGSNVAISSTGVNAVIAKALWNTVLVQDDASRGIHNPSFTANVMGQSVSHVMNFTP